MSKPNIVFILSDQHNASVMGHCGDPYIQTPNLDKLAQRGVNFQRCYCASPLCVPSRMSLLTGMLPQANSVYNNNQTLRSDLATFAHSANVAGYETLLCGRMHFYGHDQYHGFERRLVGDNTPLHHGYDIIKENFGSLWTSVLQKRDGLTNSGYGDSAVYQFDHDVTQGAISYLEGRTDERPLLMTIGLFAPHPPFVGHKDRYEHYKAILPDAHCGEDFHKTMHPGLKQWLSQRGVYDTTPEEWRTMRAAYYAMVEALDANIGKIYDTIERTLGLDNTIVVYASDHGEGMGINGIPWKGTFYDASTRVPLIVSWPKHFQQNTQVTDLTSLLDLSATFVDITGGPSLPQGQGISLVDTLHGNAPDTTQRIIHSQVGTYPGKADQPSAMVVQGNYKLISYHGFDHVQLFDVSNDPYEETDLSLLPAYATIKQTLLSALAEQWDGQKALDFCNQTQAHFSILQQWSNTTHFPMPQRWESDIARNHLDGK